MKKMFVVFALFLTSTAYAGNFEGFSIFAKAGSMSTDTEVNFSAAVDNENYDGFGRSRFFGGIGADYGFKINDKFLTLIGVEGKIGSTDVFTFSNAIGESLAIEEKNTYGVYIAPGFLVNDTALIYAKFSYNKTKLEAKFESVGNVVTGSKSFDGFGVGVGARLFIAEKIFANLELQKIQYSSEQITGLDGLVNFDPETTVGTIGIGYNF